MWNYTDEVMEHFYNPRNQGLIEAPEKPGIKVVTGEIGSISCGDALKLYLMIDEATDQILDARFQTFGCASAIASSSALTELVKGMTVDEALKLTNQDIAAYLGGLPEEKIHCSVMGEEALEAAICEYKGIPFIHHEEDESRLVCKCFAISEERIRRIVLENQLTTAEQVTNYIKAGGGCGTCLANIDDLIAEIRQEPLDVSQPIATVPAPEKPLTNLQKITLIQEILHEEIRPLLIADGGDAELYDVDGDTVKLMLKGACGSCPSSTVTLKSLIEVKLRDRVSPNLRVESI